MSWEEHETFVRNLLDKVLSRTSIWSTLDRLTTYDEDKEFWRKTFRSFIYVNEELDNLLEDECIYWNDDVEIVQSFVLKSIRQFSEENGAEQPLLPMFRDDEDKHTPEIASRHHPQREKYRTLIEKHTENDLTASLSWIW